jgi:hypothetical protein
VSECGSYDNVYKNKRPHYFSRRGQTLEWRLELETFVQQYVAAKDIVNQIKTEFSKEIRVVLLIKGAQQNVRESKIDIGNSIEKQQKVMRQAETIQ